MTWKTKQELFLQALINKCRCHLLNWCVCFW